VGHCTCPTSGSRTAAAGAVAANFGATDEAALDVLSTRPGPRGLWFELPSSWDAVLMQLEDVPSDSEDPLYPFGHALPYP
jgi:beta-glucosidase